MALTLDGTKGETFPTWTTAGRPTSPSAGQVGFNTSLSCLETYDGSNWEPNNLVRATAQNSTSGTSIDFTGIPAGVKRITVLFNETSLSGTDDFLVQIGTGGTPTTSGYVASGGRYSGTGTAVTSSTAGFNVSPGGATVAASGHMIITALGSNTWISSHSVKNTTGSVMTGGGSVALSGTLDNVRITRSGTNTFDAGSINIMYE